VVYVNTLLPFGAALYGALTRRRVLYHVHEIGLRPAILQRALVRIARFTSSKNIFVSDTQATALTMPGVPWVRVHNALDEAFRDAALSSEYDPWSTDFVVLMVASLRDYKGVPEMIQLASSLVDHAEIRFELLLNDDQESIDRYFATRQRPVNLAVYPRTLDTPQFYGRASLVLNLSRVDQWVETFGMTILEAMAFGVPVIVPPVGGPAELVRDGTEGFQVDSRDGERLRERVLELATHRDVLARMSAAARARAADFSLTRFATEICAAIDCARRKNADG